MPPPPPLPLPRERRAPGPCRACSVCAFGLQLCGAPKAHVRRARSAALRVNGFRADRYLLARRAQAVSFEGKFSDPRWVSGTWDLAQFNGANGETDWDAVIDAEVRPPCHARPTLLPAACHAIAYTTPYTQLVR